MSICVRNRIQMVLSGKAPSAPSERGEHRMSDVSRILSALERGDPGAVDQLLPLVYDELRALAAQRLARESPGQTLQPTALVHEAYLRLVEAGGGGDGGGR